MSHIFGLRGSSMVNCPLLEWLALGVATKSEWWCVLAFTSKNNQKLSQKLKISKNHVKNQLKLKNRGKKSACGRLMTQKKRFSKNISPPPPGPIFYDFFMYFYIFLYI